MSDSSPETCPNGHPTSPDQRFCSECGAPLAPPVEHLEAPPAVTMADGDAEPVAEHEQPKRRAMWAAAAAALLVAAVVVGVLLAGGDDGHTVTGTFTLMDIVSSRPDHSSCSGEGGYSDIDTGVQVLVKDGEGKTLAKGELGEGRLVDLIEATLGPDRKTKDKGKDLDLSDTDLSDVDVAYCQFEFAVDGVPDSKFYDVSVGRRGSITYTAKEMAANEWSVGFTLGGDD